MRRLAVLLVVSSYESGIGSLARHLVASARDIDYYFFVASDIGRDQRAFVRMVSSVDVVHWLGNLARLSLPDGMDIRELPAPNIAAIHHVSDGPRGPGVSEEGEKITAASRADVIHVVAQEWVDYVRSRTAIPVMLAHYPVNPRQFASERIGTRPRSPFQIGTFGFAAEMRDRKRIDVILEALSILKDMKYEFDLLVQGRHWTALTGAFIERGIRVKCLGHRSRRQALKSYHLIDLYVCSSDVEGGPLTVLEALASGVPVVSTRVGVASEALSSGGGVLVDRGNPQQMASAIAGIMEDVASYKRLCHEAIRASGRFSWENLSREYMDMYQLALAMKKRNGVKKRPLGSARFQRAVQLTRRSMRDTAMVTKVLRIKRYLGDLVGKSL